MKQAAFSTEQRDELVRLSKLVPTLPMKQAQADFIAQDVISDQKLNSKTLEALAGFLRCINFCFDGWEVKLDLEGY